MRVTENIRHGRNSQTRETYVNDSNLADTVVALLLTSPYVYQRPNPETLDKYVEQLRDQGFFQHGWSDFEVDGPNDWQRANRAIAEQAREDEMRKLLSVLSKKDDKS